MGAFLPAPPAASKTRPWPREEWLDYTEVSDPTAHAVIRDAAAGNPQAIEYAWHLYGRMVILHAVKVLPRFHGRYQHSEEILGDLYPGFVRALEKYDPAVGTRFSTYLYWWLFARSQRLLRTSNQFGALRSEKNRRIYVLLQQLDVPLSALNQEHLDQVALEAGETPEAVALVYESVRGLGPMHRRMESGAVVERAVPHEGPSPDRVAEQAEVWRFVGELSPRLQVVVVGRLVEERTLRDIGLELGLSAERVRQLEAKALRALRRAMTEPKPGPRRGEKSGDLDADSPK